jgi:polyvinyl alcohol dehydrogenase (cytochrome)
MRLFRQIGPALPLMPLFGLLLAACQGDAALAPEDAVRAEALFRDNCAACHSGEETGPAAPGSGPRRAALETRSAAAIEAALTSGLMREQGQPLTAGDRRLLAWHLGKGGKAVAAATCPGTLDLSSAPGWNRWGNGVENRRYQPVDAGGLSPRGLERLEVKWAFGFPGAARARSQPAVTPRAIFTGSQDGRVYALDTRTGCQWWSFAADAEVRSAPTLGLDATGRVKRLYFGDFAANVYALDARTGRLIWKVSVRDHPAATITGSPTLHEGRLFVPLSSTEVVSAMDGDYACCTFRGGVAALSAADGRALWRMHTVPPPVRQGVNRRGVPAFGPSGAPVWSVPTVDARRGLLYVGTGENYSSPASAMSDAIIAMELDTGRVRWVRQTVAGDAWNASCGGIGDGVNCPKEDGPDFDFGAPPILATLADGRDILLAGQKSGMVFALDPDDNGRILWRQRAGAGGFNGGIHWGMATDGRTLYVGIADTPGNRFATGPRRPGLHAFDAATGRPLWSRIEPQTCPRRAFECETALSAPVTLTDGMVFGGAHNGLLTAYSTTDGKPLWRFDTRREFKTVNGVPARGGSIDSAGPVLAGGLLVVNSGYDKFGQIPGNLLLVLGPADSGEKR